MENMTITPAAAKAKGAHFETRIAEYLATELLDDRIERRTKHGHKDTGDIGGVKIGGQRLIIECKNCPMNVDLPTWLREAHREAGNDDALAGIVIAKRKGITNIGEQFVHMTVDDLLALITGERHGHRKDFVA